MLTLGLVHGAGDSNSALVEWEYAEIVEAITLEKSAETSWKEVLGNKGLMWRFFICICCGVFSQTSGNGLISSYLTTILNGVGITKTKEVTLINGCISIWSWIVGVGCAILTSRLRRRTVFLTGTTAMLIIFVGWTIAQARYNITGVPAAGYAVIALIFIYNAAYAFSWLVLVSSYTSWSIFAHYPLADVREKRSSRTPLRLHPTNGELECGRSRC